MTPATPSLGLGVMVAPHVQVQRTDICHVGELRSPLLGQPYPLSRKNVHCKIKQTSKTKRKKEGVGQEVSWAGENVPGTKHSAEATSTNPGRQQRLCFCEQVVQMESMTAGSGDK